MASTRIPLPAERIRSATGRLAIELTVETSSNDDGLPCVGIIVQLVNDESRLATTALRRRLQERGSGSR